MIGATFWTEFTSHCLEKSMETHVTLKLWRLWQINNYCAHCRTSYCNELGKNQCAGTSNRHRLTIYCHCRLFSATYTVQCTDFKMPAENWHHNDQIIWRKLCCKLGHFFPLWTNLHGIEDEPFPAILIN